MTAIAIALAMPLWLLAAIPQNHPPTVQVELVDGDRADVLRDFMIRVTVDDPDGDRVSATLALGPQTMTMRPIVDELPPVTREIRWFVQHACEGRNRVVVHAHDDVAPDVVARGEARFDAWFGGVSDPSTRLLDLDGDDDLEVVVADANFDVAGKRDAGAILVFELENPPGASGHAPLQFRASVPAKLAQLGLYRQRQGGIFDDMTVQQFDFDGDGLLDLFAASHENGGALHVWYGGPLTASDRPDDAVLSAGAAAGLGESADPWLFFHDVTGDGVEDVIALAPYDSALLDHAGAIHVFAGGSRRLGAVAPTATLRLSSAAADDQLGSHWYRPPLVFADVTGDGSDDLVVGAPIASRGGVSSCGTIAVFAGGPALVGAVAEIAELLPENPTAGVRMSSFGLACGDVSGDGIADVAVVSAESRPGALVHVWKGGVKMVGTPKRLATLTVPIGDWSAQFDELFLHDFDGDGTRDVLTWSMGATVENVAEAGGGFLWTGGASLHGRLRATATFCSAPPQHDGLLGYGPNGVRLVDVDGDGVRDLVTASPFFDATRSGRSVVGEFEGALHVWKGGVAYAGLTAPTAELTATSGAPALLGIDEAQGFVLADVTGDGQVDLIVPAEGALPPASSLPPYSLSGGGIMVFAGGPALQGAVKPIAALFPSTGIGGGLVTWPDNLMCEDVTGDGIDDVVAAAPHYRARIGGAFEPEGALFVWRGGAALTGLPPPTAQFRGMARGEMLGWCQDVTSSVKYTRGFHCADVTGDGVLDVLVGASHATVAGRHDAGRGYVLEGGPTLVGEVTPLAILTRATPRPLDRLFHSHMSWPFLIGDLDSDGVVDWLAPDRFASVGGNFLVGALFWFPGARPAAGGGAIELTSGQDDPFHGFGE